MLDSYRPQIKEFSNAVFKINTVNLLKETNDIVRPSLLLALIFLSIRFSFNDSWLFTSGGQRIGDSALATTLPMNVQD